ncbi:MAG TPA: aminotransferase class I/II-fold pyridoxal phosphate-dependent enzyme [Oceanospirillales bacterium]|nr:aminotransferase class I/II-fold pyridoxal phosphate-dependent enzyme [Oceanospirillales bacterium]
MKSTAPNTALFPNNNEKELVIKSLFNSINKAKNHVSNNKVTPKQDLSVFRQQLKSLDFYQSTDLTQVVEWTLSHLQEGLVQITHPGYMGLFNPAPTFPSELAAIISAAFNPQNCVWSHAPVAVEIESHVIKQFIKRIGLPKAATGHFTSGGSEANATAFFCALAHNNSDFTDIGVYAFTGQACIYVSKESHLAWLKIAATSGVGRKSIRLIATDGNGQMDANELAKTIRQDKEKGHKPIMVVATAGTTNAGMIDPIKACRKLCDQYNLWLHVDAAWGGALIVSEPYKDRLQGMQTADSITIDAHKWFATTMGAGMFFTQHKQLLSESFAVSTNYMPSNDVEQDLYVNSMLWSRRFIGLPLFMSLATVSWKGYAQHIQHAIALSKYFTTKIQSHGWQLLNNSVMAIACIKPPDGALSPTQIVEKIIAKGEQWISVTKFEDQSVIRVCITNGMTSQADMDGLIDNLIEAAS